MRSLPEGVARRAVAVHTKHVGVCTGVVASAGNQGNPPLYIGVMVRFDNKRRDAVAWACCRITQPNHCTLFACAACHPVDTVHLCHCRPVWWPFEPDHYVCNHVHGSHAAFSRVDLRHRSGASVLLLRRLAVPFKLTSPRGLRQIAGAVVGALLMKEVLPSAAEDAINLGACALGDNLSTSGALVNEVLFTMVLLFVAYGCAFDERQGAVFGPVRWGMFVCTLCALPSQLIAAVCRCGLTGHGTSVDRRYSGHHHLHHWQHDSGLHRCWDELRPLHRT